MSDHMVVIMTDFEGKREPGTYERLEVLAERLSDGCAENARQSGVHVALNRVGSMMSGFFVEGEVGNADDARRVDTARFATYFWAMLERGISMITETPVASTLEDADMLIELAEEKKAKIEVAENLYRMPSERIKRELILNGVFGKVWRGHNNSRTHNYHAVSLVRSYIGFDVPIKRVIGVQGEFSVEPHEYRGTTAQTERSRHAIFFFENGALGFSHFTSLTFGSPLRGVSSTEFYGEKGMAVGDQLFVLKDERTRRSINIERVTCDADGMEVLDKFVADTDPEIVWDNPFKNYRMSDGMITIASELASIMRAVREDVEPEYGAINGRIDRQMDLAISESQRNGSVPIEIS